MSIASEPVARLVRYTGRVQGVGFRATVAGLAHDHPVTGWVRNLPDGRVELFAEGAADAVARFLDAVRTYWEDYIEDEEVEDRPPTGAHADFRVAR